MAKNWGLTEAVKVITEGTDLEAIQELSKRFPLLTYYVASNKLVDLMNFMPEYLTANKVNGSIKKSMPEPGDDTDSEEENDDDTDAAEEKPVKVKRGNPNIGKKLEPVDDSDYENMPGKALFALVGERGLKPKCAGNFKKENLVKVLKEYDAAGGADADEEEAEESAEAKGKYDGMKSIDLYKLCTKRGLDVEPKKKAEYYVAILEKDDQPVSAAEDDDWGDDDEESVEEKPVKVKQEKPVKAKAAPKSKEPAKADDDDNWDI